MMWKIDARRGPKAALRVRSTEAIPEVPAPGADALVSLRIDAGDADARVLSILSWLGRQDLRRLDKLTIRQTPFDSTVPAGSEQTVAEEILVALAEAMPVLQSLELRGHFFLNRLRHPTVRALVLEGEVISGLWRGEVAFPELERLRIEVGPNLHGVVNGWDALAPILSGELFPRLHALEIDGLCLESSARDEVARRLVESPLLPRLAELRLDAGSQEQADALARRVGALAHLERLVIRNAARISELVEVLGRKVRFPDHIDAAAALRGLLKQDDQETFAAALAARRESLGQMPWGRLEHDAATDVAHALARAGRGDELIALFWAAHQIDGARGAMLYLLGQMPGLARARQAAEMFLAMGERGPFACATQVDAYLDAGCLDEARDFLAVVTGRSHQQARFGARRIIEALRARGDEDEAIALAKQLELDPDDPVPRGDLPPSSD